MTHKTTVADMQIRVSDLRRALHDIACMPSTGDILDAKRRAAVAIIEDKWGQGDGQIVKAGDAGLGGAARPRG